KHKHLVNEDQALSINVFSLKEYGGEFRTSVFPYKLVILSKTKTKALTDFSDDVPETYFTYFGKIFGDVIDQIIEVGNVEEVKTNGKPNNSSKL
ncbi:hypothetical protein HID58_060237, partial [Brassica napus]